jgi:hypothetical protein
LGYAVTNRGTSAPASKIQTVTISATAAIPIVWLILKIIGSIVPVLGMLLLLFAALVLWVIAIPWLASFDVGFIRENWAWFSAADCVIVGSGWGIWAVYKYRRANPRDEAAPSENPF